MKQLLPPRLKSLGNLQKWFITFFVFCLISIFQNVNGQCKYVTINGTDTMSIQIPSDFPVYIITGNKQTDDSNYASDLSTWLSNNPTFPIAVFGPYNSGNSFIKIPKGVYYNYTNSRKQTIDKISTFYIVSN